MQPVRIGSVRFLNTRPLIDGLDRVQGLSFVPAVPSNLLGLLVRGEVDLALVSVIDAARADRPVAILPVGMIGSDGPTLTVRLFSPCPLDQVAEVWADTDSHTSVALARVLLGRRFGVTPAFRDFNARERMPLGEGSSADAGRTAILLIGDKVVADPPDAAEYPFTLDLGEAWREWTGLPFVYAAWMCQADRADDPAIALAAGLLDRQRRRNLLRLPSIAAQHAPAAGWPAQLAEHYLTHHLRFDLGPREQSAAQRFIDLCADDAIVPPTRLTWIDWIAQARTSSAVGGATPV